MKTKHPKNAIIAISIAAGVQDKKVKEGRTPIRPSP